MDITKFLGNWHSDSPELPFQKSNVTWSFYENGWSDFNYTTEHGFGSSPGSWEIINCQLLFHSTYYEYVFSEDNTRFTISYEDKTTIYNKIEN